MESRPVLGRIGGSAHVSRTGRGKEERRGSPKRYLKKSLRVTKFIVFLTME
jgi:hypothetical protein